MLFDFLALLCPQLGCELEQDLVNQGASAAVVMDWLLGLNDLFIIAGESKTERVLAHHSANMEALSQVPWLGWETRSGEVRGGRAIVLKVSRL
jgi:hypothetical protein